MFLTEGSVTICFSLDDLLPHSFVYLNMVLSAVNTPITLGGNKGKAGGIFEDHRSSQHPVPAIAQLFRGLSGLPMDAIE